MLRVLICDDARAFGSLLSHWIAEDPEMDVVAIVDTVDDALRRAGDRTADVIVLDHLLGAETSARVAPLLRAASPEARIVLVSGMPADRLRVAAVEAAADGYVSKASSSEQVREAIRQSVA